MLPWYVIHDMLPMTCYPWYVPHDISIWHVPMTCYPWHVHKARGYVSWTTSWVILNISWGAVHVPHDMTDVTHDMSSSCYPRYVTHDMCNPRHITHAPTTCHTCTHDMSPTTCTHDMCYPWHVEVLPTRSKTRAGCSWKMLWVYVVGNKTCRGVQYYVIGVSNLWHVVGACRGLHVVGYMDMSWVYVVGNIYLIYMSWVTHVVGNTSPTRC